MLRRHLPSLLAGLLAATLASAVQTDTRGLHAVPTPGPVAIDGRLNDWDLSGATLMCYDVEALRDVYSATVALMYDGRALYVSLHWKDPQPLGNRHDPRFEAHKGWAGDCVQLRMRTDVISHVTAWCYAPTMEPALQIEHGKSLTEPFGGDAMVLRRTTGWEMDRGAAMAFVKDADGHGYVQEMRLPWPLITLAKAPAAGEVMRCGVELLWGESDWPVHRYADNLQAGASSREFFWTARDAWGDVTLEPRGGLKLPPASWEAALAPEPMDGPVPIGYDLPRDARVTLAIETPDGRRVRNLTAAARRAKGANTERWDGLDDDGKLVPPGKYRYRALYHDGIHVRYQMSFASPGNPTWDTPDGRGAFYADHTAPAAAAAAGKFVALACPMGEGGKHLIGCDLTGQRLWGLANRVAFDGGNISLATDGTTLWVANEGKQAIIYRVEMATGRYSPWTRTARDAEGHDSQVLDLQVTERVGQNLVGIAIGPKRELAVCLRAENRVRLLDGETGDQRSELTVTEPRSACYLPDGRLLVLSGGKLMVARDGQLTSFGTTEWPDARAVTAGPDGRVYVTVQGRDQNVKVLDAQGRRVREIGRLGGRPAYGAYLADGMRQPGQPAVDSQGRLWVPEGTNNPKRTSLWSPDGRLIRDFAGTATYSGAGSVNPFDPTMAFSDNTVYRIDLDKGTSRPVYSLARRDDPADLFPPASDSRAKVVVMAGRTYLYTTDTARGANEVQVTLFDGRDWRSVAHLGIVAERDYVDQWAKYKDPMFTGHGGQAYAWADANGDGLVQPAELTFGSPAVGGKPTPMRSFYWGQLPADDGTIAYVANGLPALYTLPVNGFTKAGAPRYNPAAPVVRRADWDVLGGGNGEGMIVGGADGVFYLNQDPLVAIDKTGHVLGGYPNHHTSVHGSHTARASAPGYLIGPSSILGTAVLGQGIGEIVDLNGNLGENYLFTRDGLWVQSMFKDVRGGFETPMQAVRGMAMDGTTAGGESFGGHFTRAKDGRVWLTIGGTDARVLEVTGLDSIRRFAGDFEMTAAQYAEAQAKAQAKAARAQEAKTYAVARAAVAPTIDGRAEDWPELADNAPRGAAMAIEENEQRRYGRVAARWDDTALYLAWRVWAPQGKPRNVGQDWRLLFKTGDAVDLMVGPTDRAAAGHRRLLLTTTGDQSRAVLNIKRVAGEALAPYDFSSPWRTIGFQRVVQAGEVRMATAPIGGGYVIEAAVPWSVLGIAPKAGLKVAADVGVLQADAGGTTTSARWYWSNKATGLVNDIPGEADLTPALWGEWTLAAP